jgi:hypothetical protein
MRVPCRLHPPVGFMAQPTNHSQLDFKAQTKKPSWWFCGPNHQTAAAGFEAQTGKSKQVVLRSNHKNRSRRFWGKSGRDHGFEAKPRNTRFLSSCARCEPNTTLSDLSIVRPLSTRPVLDHPWSSQPSLLLLPQSSSLLAMPHLSPTHHETCKRVSPHETYSRVESRKFPGFKFKPRQANYSSQIKPRTTWFLNLPLNEYIDNTKAQSLNFVSKTTWSTTRRSKVKEKLKKII